MTSHNWSLQLSVRYRTIAAPEITAPEFKQEDGQLGICFHKCELPPIKLEQVDFWDKSHKKQRVGKCKNGHQIEYLFPRHENGKLDLENGSYGERGFVQKTKYEQEA